MTSDGQADLHISRQSCGLRDVKVSSSCPAELKRTGPWRVEDFDLHKRLYQGKASLLYSATCKKSQRPVAVKVYRKARLSELNWYQVEREIRIHSRLSHENIIQLYAAFEDDSNVYMVQEYATGGDLYEELKQKGGRFEEARTAALVLRPCISALMYLHSQGIIHRDIKPENILLMADRRIKLADFGLSIDATCERPVTRAGTLDYMAPEVLLCPEKSRPQENKDKVLLGYTAMVDAWAMGILAYELIVGRPPFEKQSRAATYEHIMYRRPEFPANMSPDAKDFVFIALTKAARKRPALANMLSHPWLQLPATPAVSASSTASQPPPPPDTQPPPPPDTQPPPLLGPPGPSAAPSPPGPSPLGLTPTGSTGVQSMASDLDEGRPPSGGVFEIDASSQETSVSLEPAIAHCDARLVFGGGAVMTPPAGSPARPGRQVSTQRSFQERQRLLSSTSSTSSSRHGEEEPESPQTQPTWTASLKRSMLKMISKGSSSSSRRESKSMQDAAAAAVASVNQAYRATTSSNQASAEASSSVGSRGIGGLGGVSLNVRGSNMRPQHAASFKGSVNSPSSALLGPIGLQAVPQTAPAGSQDSSVRSGKRAQRSSSVGMSSTDAEASLTRTGKPGADPRAQDKSWQAMASTASLPAAGLKGSFQASKASGGRMESPLQGPGPTPQVFTLAPQASQPVQTVQQLLAEMQSHKQARESQGGRQSPRNMSWGATAMADSVSSVGEGKARVSGNSPAGNGYEGRCTMESPFAESLSSAKPLAISRRYAMAGAGMGSSGSSSNFTDYAAAHRRPADVLRGSTSYPIHVKRNSLRPGDALTSSEAQGADGFSMSPRMERGAQLMTRSQSLALPGSMAPEPSKRSASNRYSFRRGDITSRPHRQVSMKATSEDSSGTVRQQPHQKGEKAAHKRSMTKDQNIEPSKATCGELAAAKEGLVDCGNSPTSGSGRIKAGLGFEEEEGC